MVGQTGSLWQPFNLWLSPQSPLWNDSTFCIQRRLYVSCIHSLNHVLIGLAQIYHLMSSYVVSVVKSHETCGYGQNWCAAEMCCCHQVSQHVLIWTWAGFGAGKSWWHACVVLPSCMTMSLLLLHPHGLAIHNTRFLHAYWLLVK